MANAPQTWKMLSAIQYRIQTSVLLDPTTGLYSPTGTSPFDLFQASDAAAYANNSSGTITNAIFIGVPKDFKPYSALCTFAPTGEDKVYRRALGGKIYDEILVGVRIWFNLESNSQSSPVYWYQQYQKFINTRDAFEVVIQGHAELPNAPVVQTVRADQARPGGMPTGFTIDTQVGRTFYCWDATWFHRQEWNIAGGIQP